jgi:hypothetical protein
LSQLARALRNYADTYNRLPPPAIYDKDGTPLLSWRVAILPYIGQKTLYDRFKRDERWDSPANQELIQYMPKVFTIADISVKDPNTTYYQLLVGPGAYEEGTKKKLVYTSIGDGAGNTIAVAEGAEPVTWTAPVDLAFAPDKPLPRLGGPFADGFNAVMFDGSVRFFKKEIYNEENVLRALIGWNDGEVVNLRPYLEPLYPPLPKGSPAMAARESALRVASQNNFRQFALAIHHYHDTFGRLPPYAIADKDGKPLLSWRVALLPFLDEKALHKKFKLDESWDSPHNQALLELMPRSFESPGMDADEPGKTFYQVFVGPGAGFDRDPTRRLRITDIKNGAANTLMIAEAAAAVPWTKPQDLFFESDGPLPKLGGVVPDGFYGANFDGSVHFFDNKTYTDEKALRPLLGARGEGQSNPKPK